MKLNEFVCKQCGHRWFESSAYGTCDACHTFQYLSETAPAPSPSRCYVNGIPIEHWLQGTNHA